MHSYELKVKACSLAEEARIIRRIKKQAQKKEKQPEYIVNSLVSHNKDVVRPEARATQIAFGYLKGIPYKVIEQCREDNPPHWSRVEKMVQRYGPEKDERAVKQKICAWRAGKESS